MTDFDKNLLSEDLVYTSQRILDRRQRLMAVTRELVTEFGHDGFSIRELCKRAKVSIQTIYKAFDNKERLVAISIRQNFQQYAETAQYFYDPETIEGVIERLIVGDINIRSVREYGNAIVSIFFSQTADRDLRMAASYHIITTLRPWVEEFNRKGFISPGIASEDMISAIVYLVFSEALDWSRGNLDDESFLFNKLECLLVYANGATRGAGQKKVRKYLTDLLGSQALITAIKKKCNQ